MSSKLPPVGKLLEKLPARAEGLATIADLDPAHLATPEEARAEPTFKLGVHFFEQGDKTLARTYWERAEQLHPDSWNYHRQDWSFTDDGSSGVKFGEKRGNLGDTPYYAPLDLPAIPATPQR